jgi:hypothetical protein
MELSILSCSLSVVRLEPGDPIPEWVFQSPFFSITRTGDELSIFCETEFIADGVEAIHGWRAFRVTGQLDLELPGILASLAMPLASKQISIFSISTHDTDYMVLREQSLQDAVDVLERAGHVFI